LAGGGNPPERYFRTGKEFPEMMGKYFGGRLLMVGILVLMTFSLSGCWDVDEVNLRGIANALFLDKGKTNPVKLGASFHIPGTLLPPINTTEQQFQKRYFNLTGEGQGLLDAWKDMQTNATRNTFFGQIGAIVLSEGFARENLADLLDFWGRQVDIPGNTYLLVTRSDPEELFNLKTNNNFIPGAYIQIYFRDNLRQSLAIPIQLWQVFGVVANQTSDIYMPLIEPSQGQYKIEGLAVFSKARMVGTLDAPETEALALVKEVGSGYQTVPLGMESNQLVAFFETKSKTKIQPVLSSSGQLQFTVKIEISGGLRELHPRNVDITPAEIKHYEKAAAAFAKSQVIKVLAKLQQYNSDVVGFGGKVRVKYPRYWEKVDWHQEFPKARFIVETKFTNRSTGSFR
jgi:spore germination protein KC